MEYKQIPYFVKEINGRTVTGIFAVHGNVDDGMDMSEPGSFTAGMSEGRKRVRYLWNHNGYNPPIATINSVREVGREGLPAKVLAWAPEATGGVEVVRTYYEGVELAEWVFKSVQAGDVDEMSYAYDINDFEMKDVNGQRVRVLKAVDLFDISDVNWGMNPATAGVKGLPVPGMTFRQHSAMVAATVAEFVERVQDRKNFREQDGRQLSQAIQNELKSIVGGLNDLLADRGQQTADNEMELVAIAARLKMKLTEV